MTNINYGMIYRYCATLIVTLKVAYNRTNILRSRIENPGEYFIHLCKFHYVGIVYLYDLY